MLLAKMPREKFHVAKGRNWPLQYGAVSSYLEGLRSRTQKYAPATRKMTTSAAEGRVGGCSKLKYGGLGSSQDVAISLLCDLEQVLPLVCCVTLNAFLLWA